MSTQELQSLEVEAARAAQAGRIDEAARLWERLVAAIPTHAHALYALGQLGLRNNDLPRARRWLEQLVKVDGQDPQQWLSLAVACQGMQDETGEEEALQGALTADPSDLLALVLRGNLYEKQGKTSDAARIYGAVAVVAPAADRLHPDLRASVAHAVQYRDTHLKNYGEFLDQHLAPHLQDMPAAEARRFREAVDLLVGRRRRYESFPSNFFFPRLEPIEFFEREQFPWLDAFEAQTDAIREEFSAVMQEDRGFSPYIAYPPGVPLNQWAELNHNPNWSAFRLMERGARVEANAGRCPVTMGLLKTAPQPDQPGRTPAAMFSLLKPRTRIPPHTGESNVRLVTHVPLIVPEKCGFRVGNTTREWVPGQAFVFDDSIEHEAWNESDQPRTVLIFDIWNPLLTEPERRLVTALAGAMNAFVGAPQESSL
jgi:aspartyl/asparaginyl beta-hydroxylase (cupin superfamily)